MKVKCFGNKPIFKYSTIANIAAISQVDRNRVPAIFAPGSERIK
jgi:hypothetical protein